MITRRNLGFLLAAGALAPATVVAGQPESPWPTIREALFGDRPIQDGSTLIVLDVPKRAHDSAVVPIGIKALQPQAPGNGIRTLHLIVDRNPAPLAAVFHLQPDAQQPEIGARVRIDQYTDVRVVAETSDGQLWMAQRFVKAAGGCSAPATKDKAAAMARLGQMKLKPQGVFAAGQPLPVELLISHPQYTGMQMDQVTRYWIPPDHITTVAIRWNDKPLLDIDADISLSEDPALAFTLTPEGPGTLAVAVVDSEDRHFAQSWPIGPGT